MNIKTAAIGVAAVFICYIPKKFRAAASSKT